MANKDEIHQRVTPGNPFRTVQCMKQWSTNKSIPLKM